VEERNRYHQYLGHPGRRMVPTAWCDSSGNVFVVDSCAEGAQLVVNTGAVLHGLLWKYYETRQILS
jgi:hypothetical protein